MPTSVIYFDTSSGYLRTKLPTSISYVRGLASGQRLREYLWAETSDYFGSSVSVIFVVPR